MGNIRLANGVISDYDLFALETKQLFKNCLIKLVQSNLISTSTTIDVPELSSISASTCIHILNGLDQYFSENKNCSVYDNLSTAATWCAFAGMGAVVVMDKNHSKLESDDLYTILTSQTSIDKMDKYVLDMINIKHNEYSLLSVHIHNLYNYIITQLRQLLNVTETSSLLDSEFVALETCKIMYNIGVAYQYNRSRNSTHIDNSYSTSYIVDRKYTEKFLHKAICARSSKSIDSIKSALSLLDLVTLDAGHILDCFEYLDHYDSSKVSKYYNIGKLYFYVRRVDAKTEFKVTVHNNIIGSMLGIKDKITYSYPKEFNTTYKILSPIYTKKALDLIPQTVKYLNVKFNSNGLWQFFLYVCLLNGYLAGFVYDQSDIETMNKEYDETGGYVLNKNEYSKLICSPKVYPRISITNNIAVISACQIGPDNIIYRELKVQQDGNRVKPISFKTEKLATLIDNSRSVFMGRITSIR